MTHETSSGSPDWQRTHAELSRLAKSRALLDAEELRWLLYASGIDVHRQLGYASFAEYIERLFGYSRRTVEDKLRVAAALAQLPLLEAGLADGIINGSTVRELTRVATPETEAEWLDWGSSPDGPPGRGDGSLPDSSPTTPINSNSGNLSPTVNISLGSPLGRRRAPDRANDARSSSIG